MKMGEVETLSQQRRARLRVCSEGASNEICLRNSSITNGGSVDPEKSNVRFVIPYITPFS
jgi:hypothetical protein